MRILLVYNHNRSFVHRDIEILSQDFDVDALYWRDEKSRIVSAVRDADVVLSWFASKHTLVPFLLAGWYKKPRIVIVGGFDACDIDGYGLFSSWMGRRLASYIYHAADYILPVDNSLSEVISHYVGGMDDKIVVIPTGYDSSYFKPNGKLDDMVLTVCYVDKENWWRKGLDRFVSLARLFSLHGRHERFVVVGKIADNIKSKIERIYQSDVIPNIEFTGWLEDDELLEMYQRAKVYCQLSRYEGLPNTLCEAMLCGCIPVGSDVCGIPHAIGDEGYIASSIDDMYEGVVSALNDDGHLNPRSRIAEQFTSERRRKQLLEVIYG